MADAGRRSTARIPETLAFREKWRIALAHVRTVVQAGLAIEAVVADTAYGQVGAFRSGLERLGLRYVVAVPYYLSARVLAGAPVESVAAIANALAPAAWHRVSAAGSKGALVARFAALRVRPAKSRGDRWLVCEESLTDGERKYYFSNCPPETSLRTLAALARSRWPSKCNTATSKPNSDSIISRGAAIPAGSITRCSRR